MTATESARALTARSFYPIPIPFREKGPQIKGWQTLRITGADVPKYFSGLEQNIGVLLGTPYGLADVDCDCPEALRIWPSYRPDTNMVYGRKSNPASHSIYFSDPPVRLLQFRDPLLATDKNMLLELRGLKKDGTVGLQSVAPGSTHPSGEQVRYEAGKDGEPANIDAVDLERAVSLTAAAALFARYWPAPGQGGHRSLLSLAGALCGAAWPMEDAQVFCRLVSSTLGTEVTDTYSTHAKRGHITGIPTLAEHLDKRVVDAALGWMGVGARQAPDQDRGAAAPEGSSERAPAGITVTQWPNPMEPEAFYGLAGDIVHTVEPHSEADAAGLLVQLLIGLGNAIGRGPHFRAGADLHYLNLFGVLVGQTSRGRKGSAWSVISQLLGMVDAEWAENRIQSGLSSGEGVIWAVRDPIEEQQPIKEKGRVVDYQTVITDPGVSDKRLLLLESEFASTLKVAERDGCTLSAIIRQSWDTGNLRVLTKTRPAKSTGAHISIIGHVTKDELLKCLTTTEAGNGFANRFLWVCVRRSKLLPEGGELHKVSMQPLIRRLDDAVRLGRTAGEMGRDQEAVELWAEVYPQLSGDRMGLYGAVTTRAEAITLRLSCLYALLDGSPVVAQRHLTAALAVWKYCEDSARFIFGAAIGDATADRILQALRTAAPAGITRTDMSHLFDRHQSTAEIQRALNVLQANGMVRSADEPTPGRPIERWFLVDVAKKA
jgi:hypothetical protein